MKTPAAAVACVLLALATALPLTIGEYDSLERKAEKTIPPRIQQLRDSLVGRELYQEAAFHVMSYAVPTDSDSDLCSNHSSLYQLAVVTDQPWALRMVDASSKLGDGVFQGNIQALGSYDECLAVSEPNQLFTGQLCIIQTKGVLPPVVRNPETAEFSLFPGLSLDLNLAVCLPSTCTAADVAAHWAAVAAELNASATVQPFDCSVKGDNPPGTHTWFAGVVLVSLFALVIGSSWYDLKTNYQPAQGRGALMSFSMFSSWRRLTGRDHRTDNLNTLDGLRVVAISWIVLGHRFGQSLLVPKVTLLDMERYTTAWFMSPLVNMMLAVELFFLISGCLVSFHFLRARDRGERFNIVHFYYKRYIRLTPGLAFVMMLEGCILLYVSDGPLWKRLIGYKASSCTDNWWTGLLYISNYVNPYNTCLPQSWFLSADMQLYLVSPLLLIPLSHCASDKKSAGFFNKGLLLLGVCYLATTVAAFVNAFYLELPAGSPFSPDKKTERNLSSEYVVTHVRAASWLTGVALGYVLHRTKSGRLQLNLEKLSLPLFCVSVVLCLSVVYSIAPFQSPQHQYDPLLDSVHIALHRNIFSLGAAGLVFLCVVGKGGAVQACLEWRPLRPLATLTYGVYLSHMGLQAIDLARLRQPLAFDMFTLWTSFLSDLVVANLAALVIFFLVESPFWELGQWLYKPGKEESVNEKSEFNNVYVNTSQEKTSL